MPSVAEQLRAAREAQKLSIEQLAEATKVRTDHLRALEEGNYNVFPAPIYIRGSVRICATTLKLDTRTILSHLDEELGRTKRYSEPPPLTEQKKTIVDHCTLLLARLNWKMGVAAVVLAAGILVLILILLAVRHHHKAESLEGLRPAVYHASPGGDTLPLPRR